MSSSPPLRRRPAASWNRSPFVRRGSKLGSMRAVPLVPADCHQTLSSRSIHAELTCPPNEESILKQNATYTELESEYPLSTFRGVPAEYPAEYPIAHCSCLGPAICSNEHNGCYGYGLGVPPVMSNEQLSFSQSVYNSKSPGASRWRGQTPDCVP